MPIIANNSGGGNFTPHPEGAYATTCCDVADLGVMEVTWQGTVKQQHKVDVYFFGGEWKDELTPLLVRKRFTLTLDERGNLRPFLEHWRGQKFTADELNGFDLELLIGAPAFMQISHNVTEKGTFANIDTVMKLPKGATAPGIPKGYVRVCDRPEKAQGGNQGAARGSWHDAPDPVDDGYRGEEEFANLPF